MAHFSEKSQEELKTCCTELQRIAHVAIRVIDFSVAEGHRGQELQEKYFLEGKTKLHYPDGNHNKIPSKAYDLIPFPPPKTPEEWKSPETAMRFHLLAGVVKGVAVALGYTVRWGGDWNQNNLSSDETFRDLPHVEFLG